MKLRNLGILGSLSLGLMLLCNQFTQSIEQPQESVMIEAAEKVRQLLENFQETQLGWFADDFFQAVPKEKLILGLKQNGQALGPLQRMRLCRMTGPFAGEIELISKSGKRLRITKLQLELQPPHRIVSLFLDGIDSGKDSWDEFKTDLDRLPGGKSVSICSIAPLDAVFTYHPDEPRAVGSSLKLFLLATLADQIAAQKRHWSDVIAVRDDCRSLPSGVLQDWPTGSPLTLHTLVTLMISRSDNTAADHLIHLLGRETLEEHQTKLGIAHPERNRPFLKTSELFKLKLMQTPEELNQFAHATEAEKRTTLDQLRSVPIKSPRTLTRPTVIDKVEWFFSTNDLCRLLEHLQTSPTQKDILPLLAITRPFDIDDYEWEYLGFKGGAEVGVFNLSLLGKLKNKHNWFVFSLTWNRTDASLDEPTWIRMAERALRLVERSK